MIKIILLPSILFHLEGTESFLFFKKSTVNISFIEDTFMVYVNIISIPTISITSDVQI